MKSIFFPLVVRRCKKETGALATALFSRQCLKEHRNQSKLLTASVSGLFLLSYGVCLAEHFYFFFFCTTSTLFCVPESVMKHYAGMVTVHATGTCLTKGMWTICRLGNGFPLHLVQGLRVLYGVWVVAYTVFPFAPLNSLVTLIVPKLLSNIYPDIFAGTKQE